MYTLIIEGTLKPRKKTEFTTAWNNEILPTLKKQTGFVDEILLFAADEPERGVGLSFWNTKEDAERYHREVFPKVVTGVKHLIKTPPKVRAFNVEAAEIFRIVPSKAA